MDITFVQAQLCSGDSVQEMIVVEMKISISHLNTWTVSQEHQEWDDEEGQFRGRLLNPVHPKYTVQPK
jgi:hypothetical protein